MVEGRPLDAFLACFCVQTDRDDFERLRAQHTGLFYGQDLEHDVVASLVEKEGCVSTFLQLL